MVFGVILAGVVGGFIGSSIQGGLPSDPNYRISDASYVKLFVKGNIVGLERSLTEQWNNFVNRNQNPLLKFTKTADANYHITFHTIYIRWDVFQQLYNDGRVKEITDLCRNLRSVSLTEIGAKLKLMGQSSTAKFLAKEFASLKASNEISKITEGVLRIARCKNRSYLYANDNGTMFHCFFKSDSDVNPTICIPHYYYTPSDLALHISLGKVEGTQLDGLSSDARFRIGHEIQPARIELSYNNVPKKMGVRSPITYYA
jgi:hypothetical protein